jgi:hypothetical protein
MMHEEREEIETEVLLDQIIDLSIEWSKKMNETLSFKDNLIVSIKQYATQGLRAHTIYIYNAARAPYTYYNCAQPRSAPLSEINEACEALKSEGFTIEKRPDGSLIKISW